MEGQERNTAQLERIGAAMEQRWGLEGESGKEENGDDTERSEDGPSVVATTRHSRSNDLTNE